MIAGTIALNGTPATAAFQTAAPPSERPKAPMCVSDTSFRAVSQAKRSRASCTSFGPSRPNLPPESPVPRASHASEANPAGANASVAMFPMKSCVWPNPWNRSSPGQPPDGGLPPGSTMLHASFVPSETWIVSSCVVGPVERVAA